MLFVKFCVTIHLEADRPSYRDGHRGLYIPPNADFTCLALTCDPKSEKAFTEPSPNKKAYPCNFYTESVKHIERGNRKCPKKANAQRKADHP